MKHLRRHVVRHRGEGKFRTLACSALVLVLFRVGFDLGRFYETTNFSSRLQPGEFEHHDALMLAWSEDELHHDTQSKIAASVHERCHIVVLVPDGHRRAQAAERLQQAGVPPESVTFVGIDVRLPWIRDYGPLQVKHVDGEFDLLDFDCFDASTPSHDNVPQQLARTFRSPIDHVPVSLEGGNLLSNGVGLCITTDKVLQNNRQRGRSRRSVTEVLRQKVGARQIIFLEPLQGEPTRHVDMFATFTAPDTLVLGAYDPKDDPVNASILDRNANRLRNVTTAAGKLQVHRVPMPRRHDSSWYTYTNVTYANGILLVPSYGSKFVESEAAAVALYRELLPDWRVTTVDAQVLIQQQGALHCVTLELHQMPKQLVWASRGER